MQVPVNASAIIERHKKAHHINGATAWHLLCVELEYELRRQVADLNRATGAEAAYFSNPTQWLPFGRSEMLCAVEDGAVSHCYINGMWVYAEDAVPDHQLQRWAEILSETVDEDSDRLRDERRDGEFA
jgi:hypothetical protein